MLLDLINGNIASVELFIVTLLSMLFVIFCTMPVHEAAHAFTANKLGDSTAKHNGRLTLNPIAHINYMGALLILLFGFGWAEPVPVNQWNLKKPKRDMALIAAAGPISNILMAIVLLLIVNIIDLIAGFCNVTCELYGSQLLYSGVGDVTFRVFFYVINFLYSAAIVNIYLAGFNLIPFPPLDGSRIFGAFLSDKIYYKLQSVERYSFIIVMILAATGVLSTVFGFIGDYIYRLVDFIVTLPFSLFDAYLPFHNVI